MAKKRPLNELPEFTLQQVEEFAKQPAYHTAQEFVLFNYKGVEVSLRMERDKGQKLGIPPLFKRK